MNVRVGNTAFPLASSENYSLGITLTFNIHFGETEKFRYSNYRCSKGCHNPMKLKQNEAKFDEYSNEHGEVMH